MLYIMDYGEHVATVELIDGKITVTPVSEKYVGNIQMVEDMRRRLVNGRDVVLTDSELYYSLPERLNGITWAGTPDADRIARDKAKGII